MNGGMDDSILFTTEFYLFFFFFLGPHPWHMEVARLGVKSELQLPVYATATEMPDTAEAVTYTAAHGNSGSLPH